MKNMNLTKEMKLNVWQTFRTTLGVWEAVCLSLLTAGSALVASAYGIILVNSDKLGVNITFYLCFILLLACFCMEFIVFMFNNSVHIIINSAKKLEDELFGDEYKYLKVTQNLSKSRYRYLPFLKFRVYTFWGTIILASALIITIWKFVDLLKSINL